MSGVWLTVAQVANEEGCSMRTILRWIEQDRLRARRQPGGRLRIHRDWYDEMIALGDTRESAGRILASVTEEEAR